MLAKDVSNLKDRWPLMSLRAPRETVDSLRLTLQSLEQNTDETSDPQALAELKRILLRRMADLEAADALAALSTSTQPPESPSDVLPLEAVMNDEPTKDICNGQPPAPEAEEAS